jgi:hypothetical protein
MMVPLTLDCPASGLTLVICPNYCVEKRGDRGYLLCIYSADIDLAVPPLWVLHDVHHMFNLTVAPKTTRATGASGIRQNLRQCGYVGGLFNATKVKVCEWLVGAVALGGVGEPGVASFDAGGEANALL